MARVSKSLYDNIDVENFFNQWHRDIRRFTEDLNVDCALEVIKISKISTFNISNYKKVFNLVNSRNCKPILERILKEENVSNFLNILKERDSFYPREIDRGYSIKEIFKSVKNDDYHPILFLELNKKYYIIDGRTRFYCCLFLNIPAKVRIISDKILNENCRKQIT